MLDRLLKVLVETEETLQMVPLAAKEDESPTAVPPAPAALWVSSCRLLSRGARKAAGSKPSLGNFTIF